MDVREFFVHLVLVLVGALIGVVGTYVTTQSAKERHRLDVIVFVDTGSPNWVYRAAVINSGNVTEHDVGGRVIFWSNDPITSYVGGIESNPLLISSSTQITNLDENPLDNSTYSEVYIGRLTPGDWVMVDLLTTSIPYHIRATFQSEDQSPEYIWEISDLTPVAED